MTRGAKEYQIPSFLTKVKISQDEFGKWLDKVTNAHLRRDRKRLGGQKILPVTYRKAIYKAIKDSCGRDYYTGEKLDWNLLQHFAGTKISNGRDKLIPTIDHEKLSATAPIFRICSMRTNKCKSDYSVAEVLAFAETLIQYQKNKKHPNKAMQPTSTTIVPRTDARGMPFVSVANFDIVRIDTSNVFTDIPKLLANEAARSERINQLQSPHIKPLSDFVKSLRNEVNNSAFIPDFDPWDGGVFAEVLFLLEAPGAKAVRSGFISRNNPDETAKNFFELTAQVGIPRKRSVIWNIVPWYIGNESRTRIRPANNSDRASGSSSLSRLLNLLPHLQIAVLLGRKAEYAKSIILSSKPKLHIIKTPHPSPLFVNRAPGNRERLLNALREVASLL